MTATLLSRLEDGLAALNITTDTQKLIQYIDQLAKWNQAYNLTAVRDPIEMVDKHLLDSLAILPFVDGTHILDVGAGAGLPGIPVAISRPQCQVTLIDSNGKKTRFLQAVKRELGLDNVTVLQQRVENLSQEQRFDCILSRAFSDLGQMLQYTNHLIASDGYWLAMKGRIPEQELACIQLPYTVYPYQVPHLQQNRCVVKITQSP